MDRTADAITATIAALHPAEGRRAMEPWEADSIEAVLDAAAAWVDGRLSLNDAAHCGVIEYEGRTSPRYSRFLAATITPRTDPRWAALYALICKIESPFGRFTPQGYMTREEEHQHDQARAWIAQHERQAA